MSPYASYLVETFVTLLIVCGVAFVVLYGARRMGMGRTQGGIELMGRLPLDARRSIVLVKVGAQAFLVGVADGGFTKLGELAAADVPAAVVEEPGGFAQVLSRAGARERHEKGHRRVKPDDLLARPLALVVALALVSLLPFVFMSVTSFVKISTVLQIVRSAIGAQSVPSTTVVMALAAALTLLAMAPVGQKIADRAAPLFTGNETADTGHLVQAGIDAVREPMRDFLRANASDKEKARFLDVAQRARPEADRPTVHADDLPVLIPAFVVTELSEAFAIGFLIFLPFLVIDLVVANVLLALGMQMLSPTQVSLPFKLLLFVSISGWGLLAQALVSGYK